MAFCINSKRNFIFMHFKLFRVAATPDCKMPVGNLARVFGPTIVGYSSEVSENLYFDCELSNKVRIKEMFIFYIICIFTLKNINFFYTGC